MSFCKQCIGQGNESLTRFVSKRLHDMKVWVSFVARRRLCVLCPDLFCSYSLSFSSSSFFSNSTFFLSLIRCCWTMSSSVWYWSPSPLLGLEQVRVNLCQIFSSEKNATVFSWPVASSPSLSSPYLLVRLMWRPLYHPQLHEFTFPSPLLNRLRLINMLSWALLQA